MGLFGKIFEALGFQSDDTVKPKKKEKTVHEQKSQLKLDL